MSKSATLHLLQQNKKRVPSIVFEHGLQISCLSNPQITPFSCQSSVPLPGVSHACCLSPVPLAYWPNVQKLLWEISDALYPEFRGSVPGLDGFAGQNSFQGRKCGVQRLEAALTLDFSEGSENVI